MKQLPYAVIQTGGKQYVVREGDEIVVDRLDKSAGEKLRFLPLLLVNGEENVHIGKPEIDDAEVEATVLDHVLGEKIHVFTYKAKTRYRRKIGFRPKLSKVKIERIKAPSKTEMRESKNNKNSKKIKDNQE